MVSLWKNKIIVSLFIIILISSCSPEISHKILTFFFDGVPDIKDDVEVVIIDTSKVIDSTNVSIASTIVAKPEFYVHQPYKEKNCAACHDQQKMGKLNQTPPALCYQCHENLKDSKQALHAPVEAGYCTECHSPHVAKEEKLLKRKGVDLCLYCHNKELIFANEIHVGVEENCISCHDPHGGDNNYVLQADACYKCHKDFTKRYKFVHGPVYGEFCNQCHSSHAEGTANLLLRNGQELCFYCHNKKSVFMNDVHEDIGQTSCTECHNPHGGEDKYILY